VIWSEKRIPVKEIPAIGKQIGPRVMPSLFDIKTSDNRIRARLSTDGTVVNAHGKIVAFLNGDGSAGDVYV
jgi:hypothetical protein